MTLADVTFRSAPALAAVRARRRSCGQLVGAWSIAEGAARSGWAKDGQNSPRAPLLVYLTASDLPFCWQPQRGSNPCLHLERVVS